MKEISIVGFYVNVPMYRLTHVLYIFHRSTVSLEGQEILDQEGGIAGKITLSLGDYSLSGDL